MVKTHHVPIIFIQIPYHKLHVIVISQRPNTSLIIIMNTPEQNAKQQDNLHATQVLSYTVVGIYLFHI